MDVSKIKIGDTVHVRARVDAVDGSCVPVRVYLNCARVWLRLDDITRHEPRPLQVGDVVTWGMRTHYGPILFINDGVAFVDLRKSGGRQCAVDVDMLERVAS